MMEKPFIQKSLVDQILELTLNVIEQRDEFDRHTLSKLRKLASNGDLKKAEKVAEALEPAS